MTDNVRIPTSELGENLLVYDSTVAAGSSLATELIQTYEGSLSLMVRFNLDEDSDGDAHAELRARSLGLDGHTQWSTVDSCTGSDGRLAPDGSECDVYQLVIEETTGDGTLDDVTVKTVKKNTSDTQVVHTA